MIVVAALALLWLPRTEARDGAKLLAAWIGMHQLPPEFQIRDAAKLIGGEEIVQLVRVAAAPEREPQPKGARVDWSKVIQGAADQLPRAMLFVSYPKERGASELERLFPEKLVVGKLENVGVRGGKLVLEIGSLWPGESTTSYIVERNFELGGTFKDVVRVNLTDVSNGLIAHTASARPEIAAKSEFSGGLVLHAEWSRSEPFSKNRLQSLLENVRYR